jgi:hypothetical protein
MIIEDIEANSMNSVGSHKLHVEKHVAKHYKLLISYLQNINHKIE